VLKISFADWLILKSNHFKDLMIKLRDHQINTKESFNRVKIKHRDYEAKIREIDARVKELEGILESINLVENKNVKRRKRLR